MRTSAVTVPSEPAVAVTDRPLDPTRIVTFSPGVNPFATTVNVDPGLADAGTSSDAVVFVDGAADRVWVAATVVVGAAVVAGDATMVVVGATVVVVGAAVVVVTTTGMTKVMEACAWPEVCPVAWMVTVAFPPVLVGEMVPVIWPVDVFRFNPVGSVPLTTEYETVPTILEGTNDWVETAPPTVAFTVTVSGLIDPPTLPAHPSELRSSRLNELAAVVSSSSGAPLVVAKANTRPDIPAGTQPAMPTPPSEGNWAGSTAAGMLFTFEFHSA
jgi:hypothetical protein